MTREIRRGATDRLPLYPEILPRLLNMDAAEWAAEVARYRRLPVALQAGDLDAAREIARRVNEGRPWGKKLEAVFNDRMAERAPWLMDVAPTDAAPDYEKVSDWYIRNVSRFWCEPDAAPSGMPRMGKLNSDFAKRQADAAARAADVRGPRDSAHAVLGASAGKVGRPEWLDADVWMRVNEYLKNRCGCGALAECPGDGCGRWFHVIPGGRPREYCSDACRTAACRARRNDREPNADY